MAKPFERVPRLPVPPELRETFEALKRAEKGRGLAGHGVEDITKRVALREKAAEKVEQLVEKAAQSFGGDKAKAMTHFKRFVRSGGRFMGAAGFVLPRESVERGLKRVEELRFRDVPRQLRSSVGKRGRSRA